MLRRVIQVSLPAALVAVGMSAVTAGASTSYTFNEHRDHLDTSFNQLLGINDQGQIAGYFGAGTSATVHPNRGYVAFPPYNNAIGNFHNENFPGAAQTQVIGINNSGTTVGFYADAAGDNFGFVRWHGVFRAVIDPNTPAATAAAPQVNQLLGLNNDGLAVGFYTDSSGNPHGYTFNFHNDTFHNTVLGLGASAVTTTGINNSGEITGFYQNSTSGGTKSFVQSPGHAPVTFGVAGSGLTQSFGINNYGELVGTYAIGGKQYGFTRGSSMQLGISDPAGVGATTLNGINDHGDLVGFYTDSAGNTDGFEAIP